MGRYKPKGWMGESQRHSLARKGIKTTSKNQSYKVVGAGGIIKKEMKGWKKNKNTFFEERWDKGTKEVHIIRVAQMSHPVGGKTQYRYFIEGSDSVGGFFNIGDAKSLSEAKRVAIDYMNNS